ncbi:MAG TPA: hypothetical protein PKW35_00825 [Nannocystaceae bacterium]|nr:hypothetical protein [Nannocystaceae bacterium]
MDLFESTLDDRGLSALVDDLRACAEVLGVREKGGAAQTSELSDGAGLAEAAERLRRGLLRGLQVEYTYQGRRWIDTILRGDGSFRVIRVRHESP